MKKWQYLMLLLVVTGTACKKEDVNISKENKLEGITQVVFSLANTDGGARSIFSYSDIDGPGGMDPIIRNDNLKAGSIYKGAISFFNENKDPIENVTMELIDNSEIHQVFYEVDNGLDLSIIGNDADAKGNSFGLATNVFTSKSSSGKLKITLQHNVIKPNDTNIEKAGGETYISVDFDVIIEE